MTNIQSVDLSKCNVFFDFDNTITPFDVLDDIIEKFSTDKNWVALENAWQRGEIGSKECLKGQMRSVRATKKDISRYLDKIRLDGHFQDLLELLKSRGIETAILSDSFSFFIDRILRNNGVRGIKLYSNRIRFQKNRVIPIFPHINRSCPTCAHCKKTSLVNGRGKNGRLNIYIGDRFSDICPAEHSNMVFAKGSLLEHFRKNSRKCIPFEDIGDIYRWFQEAGNVYETEAEGQLVAPQGVDPRLRRKASAGALKGK
jgi:2-hydroxy-3-keto-5-methylthiopentenyl-1-phosphate phosphatase